MTVNARTSYQTQLMIGSEATWATPVSAIKDVGYVKSVSINEGNNLIQVDAIGFRDVQTNAPGPYSFDGSIETVYQHGRLLTFVLGTPTHSNSGSDWAHVFNPGNTRLPSFTGEVSYIGNVTTTTYKFAGGKINQCVLGIDPDGVLTMKTDFIGQQDTTSSTSQVYSGTTLPVYSGYAATVSTGASGSEAILAEVKSFELTINENLKNDVKTVGQRSIQDLPEGTRKYEYKMSLVFQTEAEHAKFLGGSVSVTNGVLSTQNVVFQALRDTTAFGSGKRGIFISLGNCNYNTVNTPVSVDGVVYQDFVGYATLMNNATTWDNISSANWL